MRAVLLAALFLLTFQVALAQKSKRPRKPAVVGPKVTQVDIEGFRKVIKPNGKPLLINFWATWCEPCREEFPDLVKVDNAYKGKIDFITISLDDVADINTAVPKFLGQMKAAMPTYLLKTPDEDAAISLVAQDWSGSLPMTVLFDAEGVRSYARMGVVKTDILNAEIDKLLSKATPAAVSDLRENVFLYTGRNVFTPVAPVKP